jgi:hypothetical protein
VITLSWSQTDYITCDHINDKKQLIARTKFFSDKQVRFDLSPQFRFHSVPVYFNQRSLLNSPLIYSNFLTVILSLCLMTVFQTVLTLQNSSLGPSSERGHPFYICSIPFKIFEFLKVTQNVVITKIHANLSIN